MTIKLTQQLTKDIRKQLINLEALKLETITLMQNPDSSEKEKKRLFDLVEKLAGYIKNVSSLVHGRN